MFSWSNSRTTLPSQDQARLLTLRRTTSPHEPIPCKDSRGPARLQHRVLGEALAHRHCEWPVTPRLHHPIAQWFSENLDRPVPCRLSM